MFIDTLLLIVLISAIFKGYNKGLIVAIFSFVAIFIGLAAALKLSATVASWLEKNTGIGTNWLPFISFALTMVGVIFLVRFFALMIQKSIEFAMMGWINKLAGVTLYVVLYVSILSIILFYIIKMNLLTQQQVQASVTYEYFKNWGRVAIDIFSVILPVLKSVFSNLESFFQTKTVAFY
ncbi:MAG: CvpA family protein [Chitinophagaceae bacterium]